jgi:hypothetical protein
MDDAGFEHDVVHTNHSGAIIALETKVGTGSSTAVADSVLAGTGAGTSSWSTSPSLGGLTVDTDTLHVDATNNRVGIGTTSPNAALDVAATGSDAVHLHGQVRIDGADPSRLTIGAKDSSNLWNLDNNNGQLRVFREDWASSGTGANGSTKLSITDAGAVSLTNDLSVTGVVTPGQIDAFDNTNGPTSSTAKYLFGRSSSQAIAFHGGSGGNYITSISQTSNAKDLRVRVSQDDNATGYEYCFSVNGLHIGSGSSTTYPLQVNGGAWFNNGSQIIRNWSGSSDIDALLPGSGFGGVLDTNTSGHFAIGIRNNDAADSFSIVSGGTNSGGYTADSTYDKLVANFRADGKVGIGTTSQSRTLEVNGTFHAPGNVVAMYEFHDNVANRSVTGNTSTTLYTKTITTQGNTRLIMQLVTGQFVKSTSVTNLNIRWSMDGFYVTAGDQYLVTDHIGYGANNFREQLVCTANTGTLSAGNHILRVFADSYGTHTITMNYQSAQRSSHLYVWEVCV